MEKQTEKHTEKQWKQYKLVIALLCAVLVLLIAVCGVLLYVSSLDKALAPGSEDVVVVTIEPGSSTAEIGAQLEDKGVIASGNKFKLFSKFKRYDSQYQAGSYALSPAMTFSEIAEMLISGETNQIIFTIPEGYTTHQIAEKLADEGIVDQDKFEALLCSDLFDDEYPFLRDAEPGEGHLEGYLFPLTYTVEYNDDEEAIICAMLDQFAAVFTDNWEAQARQQGHSVHDIVIMASIIERETRIDEERELVSSVIYNRLAKDMPLQMCSTVQYILGEQKDILSEADTQIESPYNTYIYPGLPVGPVSCPGKAALEAALHPEDTDYLYFVVSEKLDGTQNFSSDYDQFLKDKDAYYEAYEAQEEE